MPPPDNGAAGSATHAPAALVPLTIPIVNGAANEVKDIAPPPPETYYPQGTTPGAGATQKLVNGAWVALERYWPDGTTPGAGATHILDGSAWVPLPAAAPSPEQTFAVAILGSLDAGGVRERRRVAARELPIVLAGVSPTKGGPLFLLAELAQPYRSNENVTSCSGLVLDVDHESEAGITAIHAELQRHGLGFMYAPTHSNTPPDDCRQRIVVPFSRDLPGAQWRSFRAQFPKWDSAIGASQSYYLPPLGVAWTIVHGKLLDPFEPIAFEAGPGRSREKKTSPADTTRPSAYRMARASAYLAKIPPAIEGQIADGGKFTGGTHTFATCVKLVRGFDLTDEEAFSVLTPWNATCVPPWDESGLRRKIREADEKGDMPRGALLAEGAPFTDSGNAERLVARYGSQIRFVTTWGAWLAWDGRRWDRDGAALRVSDLAKETVRELGIRAADESDDERRKGMKGWALSSENKGRRDATVSLARSESAIGITHRGLDADPFALNVANGTIDLRTGELRTHQPTDLLTKLADVTYARDGKCPRWETFVSEIMKGDRELIGFLKRAIGYSLTGDVREHALFFCHGKGANGKSTLFNILHRLMGNYAGVCSPELLFQKQGEVHPTGQADLAGQRFVTSVETRNGRRWDEELLKQLTGGDPLKARRMREDMWQFLPSHKIWVAANSKPDVHATDDGFWRRFRTVPFHVSFNGSADKSLEVKLAEELPGILRWAVEGCIEWQTNGLGEPAEVKQATESYRSEQDLLGQFLETCEKDPTFECSRSELRRAYEGWSKNAGAYTLGARQFTAQLRQRGYEEASAKRWPGLGTSEPGWKGIKPPELNFTPAGHPSKPQFEIPKTTGELRHFNKPS